MNIEQGIENGYIDDISTTPFLQMEKVHEFNRIRTP